jgi:pimeloyl-ACP methyl ester carboxylesterase
VAEFVEVDGVRLEFRWHGPPPAAAATLVFLHEGLGSITQWRDFPAELCSRLGCGGLVYNRCGHGKSDALSAPRSVEFMHDEATSVLPRLLKIFEIQRPVLIGHSDGASIALIYAGSVGDPCALVLEAPHVFVEDVTVTRIAELRDMYRTTDLRTRLARHHANVDSLFQYWTDVWLRPDFRGWNIESYLPHVMCPTLVIQGRQDEYGTDHQVSAVTSSLGGRCEGLMLDRCGHAPHIDQRARVADIVTQFIRHLQ